MAVWKAHDPKSQGCGRNKSASDPGRTRLGYYWLAVGKGDGTMRIQGGGGVKKVVDCEYLGVNSPEQL